MSDTAAALLQVAALLTALAVCYRPLGGYMARAYTSEHHTRVERGLYRVMGVDPDGDQRWSVYARSVLAFSLVSVVGLYALQRLQGDLPLSLGFPGVAPDQAFNTAASFTTNTNWQSYSGESTMGHLTQMAGLAVQNFASAAVGMAVAVAMIRGFMRSRTDRLGNFWVDLVRGSLRILLPIAVLGTSGAGRAAARCRTCRTAPTSPPSPARPRPSPAGRSPRRRSSRSSAPTAVASTTRTRRTRSRTPTRSATCFEIFLLLLIPVSLTRTFGLMVGQKRQGYAILAAMGVIWAVLLVSVSALEVAPPGYGVPDGRRVPWRARRPGSGGHVRPCSRCPRRARRPARSTPSTRRSRPSAVGC